MEINRNSKSGGELASVQVRHDLRPGDIGAVVSMHGLIYAREHGFDATFEAYVAGPLAEFVMARRSRDRIWLAERNGKLVGSVAIVEAAARNAQLRWFLVDPQARGTGLGRRLLADAVTFSKGSGYESLFLWTVNALAAAARLYREAGFVKTEARPGRMWGVNVVEERYEIRFTAQSD